MKELLFDVNKGKETDNQFLGRNGYFKCNGLSLYEYDNALRIYPITSKNEDGRCFIEIPLNDLDQFIDTIKEIDNGQVKPSWMDKHSVNCIKCGVLFDEREGLTPANGEGSLCPECVDDEVMEG